MLTVPFSKYEAAQNDFVMIDNRDRWFPEDFMKSFTQFVCHRRKGIGADGVIFIERSDKTDFKMLFFNPDGSFGSMCGNGGRCAILFALMHHISGTSNVFEVLEQNYTGEITDKKIRLYFPEPKELTYNISLQLLDQSLTMHYAHVGAPHAVVCIEDILKPKYMSIEHVDVALFGKAVRYHKNFSPVGVNVNFLQIDKDNIVHIRTYEKGVEAETESCGTGTIASALIATRIKNLQSPVHLISHGGDHLQVGFINEHDRIKNIYIEGPAHFVYSGVISFDPESDNFIVKEIMRKDD